jgi:hypothetical protein
MEALCELRRYIEMGDTAAALALLDEMDEMSKDDKVQKIASVMRVLDEGENLGTFLDDFKGMPRGEALAALEQPYERLLEGLPRPGSVAELTPTRLSLLTGHRGGENLPQGAAEARE